jgi:hypothetical protein
MIDALLELPTHLRRRLAAALESGVVGAPYSLASLRSVLDNRGGTEKIVEALAQLDRMGIRGAASGAWIRAVEEAAARTPRPDFVWSGPSVPGVNARDTRQVYEELLGSAKQSVWASTYAFFDGPKAFEVLARRMDTTRDLRVTLLLNIQRKRGDTTLTDQLVRRFSERFWKAEWPGKSHPQVYFDPRSLEEGGPSGVLHAKAVVTDFVEDSRKTSESPHADQRQIVRFSRHLGQVLR